MNDFLTGLLVATLSSSAVTLLLVCWKTKLAACFGGAWSTIYGYQSCVCFWRVFPYALQNFL